MRAVESRWIALPVHKADERACEIVVYIEDICKWKTNEDWGKHWKIIYKYDWDLDRFVEYKSPFTRKETLPIKKPIYILGLELKLYLI